MSVGDRFLDTGGVRKILELSFLTYDPNITCFLMEHPVYFVLIKSLFLCIE